MVSFNRNDIHKPGWVQDVELLVARCAMYGFFVEVAAEKLTGHSWFLEDMARIVKDPLLCTFNDQVSITFTSLPSALLASDKALHRNSWQGVPVRGLLALLFVLRTLYIMSTVIDPFVSCGEPAYPLRTWKACLTGNGERPLQCYWTSIGKRGVLLPLSQSRCPRSERAQLEASINHPMRQAPVHHTNPTLAVGSYHSRPGANCPLVFTESDSSVKVIVDITEEKGSNHLISNDSQRLGAEAHKPRNHSQKLLLYNNEHWIIN
eukprot:g3706.t1